MFMVLLGFQKVEEERRTLGATELIELDLEGVLLVHKVVFVGTSG